MNSSITGNRVRASIVQLGGLAATSQLRGRGHSRHDLSSALVSGRIVRVRQGWYSHRDVHPLVLDAARVGGRLTCVSALALHGAGLFARPELHVSVASHSCRLRMPRDSRSRIAEREASGVVVHWRDHDAPGRLLMPPLAAIRDLVQCQPPDVCSSLAGLVLREHPRLSRHWAGFLSSLPAVHRPWLHRVDGVCESGTEGLFWFRMRDQPFPLRRQVRVAGVGRVDFLIGTSLVVEIDGVGYHTSPEAFESDRRRDALLSALGYRVLRFSYAQMMFRWWEVEGAVVAAVLRGDHH